MLRNEIGTLKSEDQAFTNQIELCQYHLESNHDALGMLSIDKTMHGFKNRMREIIMYDF
jgi:hypothetical protein